MALVASLEILLEDIPGLVVADSVQTMGAEHFAAKAQSEALEWSDPRDWHANPVMTGDQRTVNGRTWKSTMDHNVWAPGVSGWREVVAEGYPAWVQPSGAHDAYQIGDRVSFEGANYESVINANVWSPTGYPAGGRRSPDDLAAHRGIINALAMRGDRAVLGAAFFMGSQGQIFLLLSAY